LFKKSNDLFIGKPLHIIQGQMHKGSKKNQMFVGEEKLKNRNISF